MHSGASLLTMEIRDKARSWGGFLRLNYWFLGLCGRGGEADQSLGSEKEKPAGGGFLGGDDSVGRRCRVEEDLWMENSAHRHLLQAGYHAVAVPGVASPFMPAGHPLSA
jgi:hypothetical protein